MKSLYLECRMGAAGDMLCAALYELLDQQAQEAFLTQMNGLGLPRVRVCALADQKCGIQGTRMAVTIGDEEESPAEAINHIEQGHHHDHSQDCSHGHHHQDIYPHTHSSLSHIQELIQSLDLPKSVKDNALSVYRLLAGAEAKAHGKPVDLVHFHEVGALDAVADIVGFCLLVDRLKVDHITASPLHVGSGHVRTSHGVLPVPAPATAHILQGVPTYSDGTAGELLTPTGAALIKHFATGFGAMPHMVHEKIGYGMGKKNFGAANCVRAFLGQSADQHVPGGSIAELRCNVDDMTPEAVGFATEALLAEGAKDVYVQPVYMKKNRPGFVVVCLCDDRDAERMARLMIKYTSTLGVRKYSCERYTLDRTIEEADTSLGKIRFKRASGYGISRTKPEYDDVAQAAKNHGISFEEAYKTILDEKSGSFK